MDPGRSALPAACSADEDRCMLETSWTRTGEAAAASVRAAAARSLALTLERRAKRAGAHALLYRRDAAGLRRAPVQHELSVN